MESSKSIREKEAASLRDWFSKQKRFGSWGAMERALGITEDYLPLIKRGARRAVDPTLRAKIYEATGLETFKPIRNLEAVRPSFKRQKTEKRLPSRQKIAVAEEVSKDAQISDAQMSRLDDEIASKKATSIRKLLVNLAKELEFFKKQSEQARRTFRKEVPGEDVGYITTLLKALYDEDQFQRWLLFSDYKLRSKEAN